jgi:ornithine cyclodeaminase
MSELLYLESARVKELCRRLDPLELVENALSEHFLQRTVLPPEAYLAWRPEVGMARSLCMPGFVVGQPGVKIINSNPLNVARGQPRATGLTVLFDVQSGRPICLMQGAGISALRTACVTIICALRLLRHDSTRAAIIGAGKQAVAHVEMICSRLNGIREMVIYDLDAARATRLRESARCYAEEAGIDLEIASSAEEAIRGSQLVVTVTTSTQPYIPLAWLEPGALVAHVSLDDLLPEVFLKAERLLVDDWHLVAADKRRILGKLIHSGLIASPSQVVPKGFCGRRVDAELGALITGAHKGRENDQERIIVNPFGLAIEDLALAKNVFELAKSCGVGHVLPE